MHWVTIIWTGVGTASAMLALVHGYFWTRQRDSLGSLLFSLMAAGTSAMAACELLMMQAPGPAAYSGVLRWFHVPVWIAFVSMVGFVQVQLGGRLWLAGLAVAARTLSLIPNFWGAPNVNFREITSLQKIRFLGEEIAVPVGVPNPWMLLAQLSLLLLLVWVLDATWSAWRKGHRRLALTVGGGLAFFVALAGVQAVLVFWGIIRAPVMASPFFLGIIAFMGFELGSELLRAARLAQDLQAKEAELRTSEERLNLAAEGAGAGLWSLDAISGRFWSTPKALEMFGFPAGAEVDIDAFLGVVHSDDRQRLRETIQQALHSGREVNTEYRAVLNAGNVRWFASRGRTHRHGNGEPQRLMGVTVDITERKLREHEMMQQRAELEHLSRVASLSELSGSLAHELNQPLAIILSNAQAAQRLLARQPPDLVELQDILTDIVNEDRRAGDVIKRLRAMLKRGEPNRSPLSLNEAVEEVLQLTRSDLLSRSITVQRNLAAGLPSVPGDRIPIEQVVLNLLFNACDAVAGNAPGDRQLVLATRCAGNAVGFFIRDNGSGLPEDTESVFKPFYTTKPSGLGMGLSICRTIVSAHGGRLWAERNPDRGATFHFYLPIAEPTL
jgi:PAS domain S-box-containing protein